MSDELKVPGGLRVADRIVCGAIALPDGTVDDDAVASGANIGAAKVGHDYLKAFAQEATANAAADTRFLHRARAAGKIEEVAFGLVTPPDTASGSSGRTATLDVQKNGVTVLLATIVLDSTNTAYVVETGTLVADPSYVAGDIFKAIVTIGGSAGTHAKGVFYQVHFRELPAA